MTNNAIIDEIHAVRSEYGQRFGNDLHAICEDARKKQGHQGRRIVPANPKRADRKVDGGRAA